VVVVWPVLLFSMKRVFRNLFAIVAVVQTSLCASAGESNSPAALRPPWLDRHLSLTDCLNLALSNNGDVLKSRKDLEAAHGLSVQTRAVVIPKVQLNAEYGIVGRDAVDRLEVPALPMLPEGLSIDPGDQRWAADIRLVQTISEGGRLRSAVRTSKLLRERAVAQHNVLLANVITDVRTAFYDVLLAEQEIIVSTAAIALLEKELEDSRRRFEAGTVPRFNVLRAEVELANARPQLSRARNNHRIAKNVLVNLLGYNVPHDLFEDLPLHLAGTLEVDKLDVSLPEALKQALELRPELEAARKAELLRREGLVQARAGAYPRLDGYVGYGARKSMFAAELDREVHGWEAGVQVTWNIFDGALTRGKVAEANALLEQAQLDQQDLARKIELEVRSACSTLTEAWEVLQSQQKVIEQAEESLRLARARAEAGTGTQLDVLSAQTALTQARTTTIRAKRDYAVACARLERAIGAANPDRITGKGAENQTK